MDPEEEKEAMEEPEKTKASSLRRRSSVGRSIRRSRSCAGRNGLTFEDQLLVISSSGDEGDSVLERLSKMVNVVVSTTCRSLLAENDKVLKDFGNDDERGDSIESMASSLGQRPLLQDSQLQDLQLLVEKLKTSAVGGSSSSSAAKTEIVSSRLRNLRDYVSTMDGEKASWQDLLHSRKDEFNRSKNDYQVASRGEVRADGGNLSHEEDAWLRSMSDGSGELHRVTKQATDLAVAEDSFRHQMARRRKALDDRDTELQITCRKMALASKRLVVTKEEKVPNASSSFETELKSWLDQMELLER